MASPTGVLLWAFFSERLNLWKEVSDVVEFYFVVELLRPKIISAQRVIRQAI